MQLMTNYKLKGIYQVVFFAFMSLTSFNATASHATYSIEYTEESEEKPSLNNVKIRAHIFKGGTASGFVEVKTDSDGKFSVEKDDGASTRIIIHTIENENNLKYICEGSNKPDSQKIIINCTKNNPSN